MVKQGGGGDITNTYIHLAEMTVGLKLKKQHHVNEKYWLRFKC